MSPAFSRLACRFVQYVALGTGGVLGLGAVHAADPASFKVGGVLSLSGPYGIFGDAMRKGVEMAVESRQGKVLGVPIEVIWEDSETKPQTAVQKTTRLISEGVHTIFGATGSAPTIAIMNIARQRKIPHLVTMAAGDEITLPGGSRYTFRTSPRIGMQHRSALAFARERGMQRIYGVTADYQALRDSWAWFEREARKAGMQVVGSDFTPLGTRDYASVIDKVMRSGADGVALFITGNDGISFIRQAAQVNMQEGRTLFGPVLTDETLAAALGDLSLGVYTGIYYHFSMDNPASHAFVQAYRKKYGEYPPSGAGEAYDGMRWWLDVVDSTGSWDKEKWVSAFENSVYNNSIKGVKSMRVCDHQARQAGYWGVVAKGQAPEPDYVLQITRAYAPEQVFEPCP